MSAAGVKIELEKLISDYEERNHLSWEMCQRAKHSMPGGNTRSGNWTDPFPPYIERAEGVYLHDVDGHRLLDFAFNNSSMALGHAHPAVVEAIQHAATLGTGYNRPTWAEIEHAELIKDRLPSIETLRFTNSGTESVILAIRAAIGFTGKRKIGKMEGQYHGTGDHAMVSLTPPLGEASGPADRPWSVPTSVGLSGAADEVIVLPFNNLAACEAILTENADQLAALLVDPFQTNVGMCIPAPGFHEGLREITKHLGIVLIWDEIVSFRVAYNGAQGMLGITPDLTTLGKVIAGGTAGGVFGGRADIMEQFSPASGPKIPQAGTFNANPITTAAGIATLRALSPDLYTKMAAGSERVTKALSAVFTEAGIEHSTNSVGSIFKVYFTGTPPINYRDTIRDDKARMKKLTFWLLNNDIHWQAGGYVSAVTEDRHLDQLVSAVKRAIAEI